MAVVVAGGRTVLSRGASQLTTSPAPCPAYSKQFIGPESPPDLPAFYQTIVNAANMSVSHIGDGTYAIQKGTASSGAYDASAVSSASITGSFRLWLEPQQTDKNIVAGINDNPTATNDNTGFDGQWVLNELAEARVYIDTTLEAGPFTYAAGDRLWIDRNPAGDIEFRQGANWSSATSRFIYPAASGAYSGAAYYDSSAYYLGTAWRTAFFVPQDLVGTSSLTFTASATATGLGALSGASALTFSPSATATGPGALSGTSTLTFSPSSTLTGKGALSGASTITFSPSATLTGKGALSGAGSLTFAPSGTLTGPGALSGSSALTFVTAATATGTGALSGTSALSFAPSATITGLGALSGTSALTFGPASTLTGLAPITGAASVTFAAAGTLAGIAYITGGASLDFTAAGTLTGFDATAAMLRGRRRRRGAFSDYGIWREGGGIVG